MNKERVVNSNKTNSAFLAKKRARKQLEKSSNTNINDVIISPLITEKCTLLKEKLNKYSFIVMKTANKVSVKKAVESLFDVKVSGVNTSIRHGKLKRKGQNLYQRTSKKIATISFKQGDMVEIMEKTVGGDSNN